MNLKIFKGYERFEEHYPSEAVEYAMANKEEAIPELLEILEYTLSDAENLAKDDKYLVHFPAIYLLAYFREHKAYENIIKLAFLPDEVIYDLLGDMITEDYKNILASVCDGNIEPIKEIIEDSSLDEFVRAEALESLLILLNYGVVSREELVFYFKQLINGKLEADYSYVWEALPRCCSLIHPAGLQDDMEKAVEEDKVMGVYADLDFMNQQLERPINEVLAELKENADYFLIDADEVISLEEWVGNSSSDEDYDSDFPFAVDKMEDDGFLRSMSSWLPSVPIRNDNKVGRNDPCPCGSGKKYKKCCLGKEEK